MPQLETQSARVGESELAYERSADDSAWASVHVCLFPCVNVRMCTRVGACTWYLLEAALHLSVAHLAPAKILRRRIFSVHQLRRRNDENGETQTTKERKKEPESSAKANLIERRVQTLRSRATMSQGPTNQNAGFVIHPHVKSCQVKGQQQAPGKTLKYTTVPQLI